MEHKTWDIYIEFQGSPLYAEYFDAYGDMDETEVVQHVLDNITIEATEVEE